MAKLKTIDSTDELYLYLSFHPSGDNFSAEDIHLSKLMGEKFGEFQKKVFASPTDGEIIYRVKKPVFAATHEDCEEFFKKLKFVMASLPSLLPHFTQFKESESQ